MAIYGYDYFGESKYGSPLYIDFGVEPFVAEAISHTQIKVTWSEPGGNWTKFRLMRSRSGPSVNETDGEILLNILTGKTPQTYVDTISTSGWYYYTIFILNDDLDTWECASTTFALSVDDHGYSQRLWDLTPVYFKKVHDTVAGYSPIVYQVAPTIYMSGEDSADNQHLLSFYDVFGYGFDILRSQADTILSGYDSSAVSYDRLNLLSTQFGAEVERSVPAQTSRNLVKNLGLLYRKRGTADGIREMLALATGWQVDVMVGPNFMLTEDQANFVNPIIPDWDPTVRYIIGDIVYYLGHRFQALQVAYGSAQGPDPTGDTAYWNRMDTIEQNQDLVRQDTGGISTWEAIDLTTGLPLTPFTSLHIGRGVTDPTDPTVISTNALGVTNTSASTTDILIRSVPTYADQDDFDRELTTASVIPVPSATSWFDPTVQYEQGDMVNFAGVVYKALRPTQRYPVSSDWEPLGYDRRVRIALSFYTHGLFSGSDTLNNVTPYLMAFDDQGDLMYEVYLVQNAVIGGGTEFAYDTFNRAGVMAPGRVFDVGTGNWSIVDGAWSQNWILNDSGFMYPTGSGFNAAVTDTLNANLSLGLTLKNVGSKKIGLIFRVVTTPIGNPPRHLYTGWFATQDGLYKVNDSVVDSTPTGTYLSSFVNGDRMTVILEGDTITVNRNGSSVVSVTDSFNDTATIHGIAAF